MFFGNFSVVSWFLKNLLLATTRQCLSWFFQEMNFGEISMDFCQLLGIPDRAIFMVFFGTGIRSWLGMVLKEPTFGKSCQLPACPGHGFGTQPLAF